MGSPSTVPVAPAGAKDPGQVHGLAPNTKYFYGDLTDVPTRDAPIPVSEIIDVLTDATQRPTRTGFLAKKQTAGQWDSHTEVVRKAHQNDVATQAHEAGHAIETMGPVRIKEATVAVRKELVKSGRELYVNEEPPNGYASEGWAETVRKHVTGQELSPVLKAYMDEQLAKFPRFRERIDKARNLAAMWEKQGWEKSLDAAQRSSKEPTVKRWADKLKKAVSNPREKLFTGLDAVERMEKATRTRELDIAEREIKHIEERLMQPDLRAKDELRLNKQLVEYEKRRDAARTIKTVSEDAAAATGPSAVGAQAGPTAAASKTDNYGGTGQLGPESGKGLREVLAPVVGVLKGAARVSRLASFKRLVIALRAKDYLNNKAFTGINPETGAPMFADAPLEPGFRREHIQAALDSYGNDPVLVQAAKDFTEFQRRPWRAAMRAAGIPEARIKAIEANNPNYTHFDRYFPDAEQTGRSGSKNLVQQRSGSTREIYDPIETAIRDAEKWIKMEGQIQFDKALIEWSEKYGGVGEFIENIPKSKVPTEFSLLEIKKKLDQVFAEEFPDGVPAEMLDEAAVVFRYAKRPPGYDNIVSINDKWYQLSEDMTRARETLSPQGKEMMVPFGALIRGMQKVSSGVRMGATQLNVGFQIGNAIRDAFTYSMNTGRSPFSEARGFASSPEVTGLYRASGAEASTYGAKNRATAAAHVEGILEPPVPGGAVGRAFRHPIRSMHDLATFIESGPRKAEFRHHLEKSGWKPGQEVTAEQLMRFGNAAADVTTDFRRGGTWVKPLSTVVAFLNPSVQGISKNFRNWRTNPTRTAMTAAAIVGIPTALNWWANKDDEDYQAQPAWMRKGYWWVKTPAGAVKIPKGPGVQIIANAIEDGLDRMYLGGDVTKEQMDKWTASVMDTFQEWVKNEAPPILPNAPSILWDTAVNKQNFSGRPVVPKRLRDEEVLEQYTEETSEPAKWISKGLSKVDEFLPKALKIGDISPMKIEYAADQVTGGISRDVTGTAALIGLGNRETAPFKKKPFLGRFMTTGVESDAFEKVFDIEDELRKLRSTSILHAKDEYRGGRVQGIPASAVTAYNAASKALDAQRKAAIIEKDPVKKKAMQRAFHERAIYLYNYGLQLTERAKELQAK